MLNAMAWALACFGVVAADIALSVVLFSVLDAVSVLTGYPIDNLDIQWFQAAAQTASFFDGAAVVALSVAALVYGALAGRAPAWRGSKCCMEAHRMRCRDRPIHAGGH